MSSSWSRFWSWPRSKPGPNWSIFGQTWARAIHYFQKAHHHIPSPKQHIPSPFHQKLLSHQIPHTLTSICKNLVRNRRGGVRNYCQAPGPGSGHGQGPNLVLTGQFFVKPGPGLYTIFKKPTTYPHQNSTYPHHFTTNFYLIKYHIPSPQFVKIWFGMGGRG